MRAMQPRHQYAKSSDGVRRRDPIVGLLWRGEPGEPAPPPERTRLRAIFEAFAARGLRAQAVLYDEASAEAVREQLLEMDGVLVWVDPIVRGRDRSGLDAILREVAARGVFVSAHPDVALAMGTKEVLYRTRELPWGTDTHVYRTLDELLQGMPALLRSVGPRVLKQDRGSGGKGVWRVELLRDAEAPADMLVRVQPGERGARVEDMRFGHFVEQRRPYTAYFDGRVLFIDQPFLARCREGMTRAYLVHDRLAGFGHQYVTALTPAAPGASAPDPEPRLYFGPDEPAFQPLRRLLECGWIAEMRRVLGLDRDSLPVIWDADFLLGPRSPAGDDEYLLAEINVSGVFPIPGEAVARLVDAAIERVMTR